MSDDEHRIVGAAREALLLAQIARLTSERDAALAGAVRVKKLVWSGDSPLRSEAFTAFGDYVVTARHDGVWRLLTPTAVEWVSYGKQETAQAAAQADHEARIRAAIEPAAPSVSAAETILARLDPEALRPILSRLANKTPTTCYYSEDFAETMRALPEKAATEAGKMPPLEQGLMFVAATAGGRLSVGDKLAAEFTSIMHGAQDVGSYRVRIERLATKENSDE